jgi:hypothetical protein
MAPEAVQNFEGDMVERGSEVMDGIANDSSENLRLRDWWWPVNEDLVVGSYPKAVRAEIEEVADPPLRVLDVLIGPFDL